MAQAQETRFQVESTVIFFSDQILNPGAFKLGSSLHRLTQGPHRLLADVVGRGAEELHKDGDGARIDHDAGVLRGAGRDVGERPRRLELELGEVGALEELDEVRHDASLDHLLDRGAALCSKKRRRGTARMRGKREVSGRG